MVQLTESHRLPIISAKIMELLCGYLNDNKVAFYIWLMTYLDVANSPCVLLRQGRGTCPPRSLNPGLTNEDLFQWYRSIRGDEQSTMTSKGQVTELWEVSRKERGKTHGAGI